VALLKAVDCSEYKYAARSADAVSLMSSLAI
jgi:hypothetical protein